MCVENFKFYHWFVISILLGLAGAWIMLSIGPRPTVKDNTMSRGQLEDVAMGQPIMLPGAAGFGVAREPRPIQVYPQDGHHLATTLLPWSVPKDQLPKGVDPRLARREVEFKCECPVPYVPSTRLPRPPHFQFNFRTIDDEIPRLEKAREADLAAGFELQRLRRQLPQRMSGLTVASTGLRQIDESLGADIEFPLAKRSAVLTINSPESKLDLGRELTITMNGRALAPLKRTDANAEGRWTTTVPAEALNDGAAQVLHLARHQSPVMIAGVQIMNPQYTIVDFLADAKQLNPKLDYSVKTVWSPKWMYTTWLASSVIVIGILWPLAIQLMIRAGLAKRPIEREFDLSRFKRTKIPEKAKPASPAPTEDDELLRLEAEMERRLREDGDEIQITPSPKPPEEEPIRVLAAKVEETVPAADQVEEHKVFGGEYYPVVKKVERTTRKEGE